MGVSHFPCRSLEVSGDSWVCSWDLVVSAIATVLSKAARSKTIREPPGEQN